MAKKTDAGDMFNIDSSDAASFEAAKPQRDVRAIIKSFFALALIALFTIFAIQNSESVDVEFITWDFSIPLILLLIASALVGIVAFEFGSYLRKRSSAKNS